MQACSSRGLHAPALPEQPRLRAARARRWLQPPQALAEQAAFGEGVSTCTFALGASTVTLETGRVGRQANCAVLATEGETVLLSTICAETRAAAGSDSSFLPLTCVYQERFSAAGRTPTGFLKREGKSRDAEVLISRLVDRPLRPMFAAGFSCETQVMQMVLAWDGLRPPDALAITAAGAAAALSDLPFSKPVAGVRVGWVKGVPVVNPTLEQMAASQLDLVVAGTCDALLMIEGYGDFVSEQQMLEAVEAGHAAVRIACSAIAAWAVSAGKQKKLGSIVLPPAGLQEAVEALCAADLGAAFRTRSKQERASALAGVERRATAALSASYSLSDISSAMKEAHKRAMRSLLRSERLRSDGRAPADVRPISAEAGLLARCHGSSLFTRGETQAIAVVTLGGENDAQRADGMAGETKKGFALTYIFPPFCVGEVGRVGQPSRRELGHGNLAERALLPTLPAEADFPYTIRLESTITESNGSSSMATVCAGSLALQDAGVPVLRPVAGVAMGLVLPSRPGEDAIILTDIMGSEDYLGDMDFKVAGDAEGVTAFQCVPHLPPPSATSDPLRLRRMDIKCEGITAAILREALEAARVGRIHILHRMAAASPPPRAALAPNAPRIGRVRIDPSKAGMVIGPGGKGIRNICESTGATDVQISDQGAVTVTAPTQAALEAALALVQGTTAELVVGSVYRRVRVTSLTDFGAFVEVMPGKTGLLHISELALTRVTRVSDEVKPGDVVDVQLLECVTHPSRRPLLLTPLPSSG